MRLWKLIKRAIENRQFDGYKIKNVEIQPEPKRYCPYCNKEVIPSETKNYAWQCLDCDEDFYDFEVKSGC